MSFESNSAIAVIPARGGSKGIPRKNLIDYGGEPLVVRTVRLALAANVFEKVYVSTDDNEIATVAKDAGAEVVIRPKPLASDTASSESAVLHVLEEHHLKYEQYPEITVFLQCTSPFTTIEDIQSSIDKIAREGCDSVFTASEHHAFIWTEGDLSQGWSGVNHDSKMRLRRQDLAPEFIEAGNLYCFRTEGFLTKKHRFFGRTEGVLIPKWRTFEIDSSEDLLICEAIGGTFLQQADPATELPQSIAAIVFDFDGTMTDDTVYVSEKGEETVCCSRSDGYGIELLRQHGYRMLILSRETNPVVSVRAKKLGLDTIQASMNKIEDLKQWCTDNSVLPESLIFMGNDLNDLDCLSFSGCGVVPSNAHTSAKKCADLVLERSGGQGAVRELCELILSSKSEPS